MDFKATFDDSSCLRPTMVKFIEGENRTLPVRAGRSRDRQSVLCGYSVSFFQDEKWQGDGADESGRAKQMFFRVANCTFKMMLFILRKPYLS